MALLATLQEVDVRLFGRIFNHGCRWSATRWLAKVVSHSGDGFLHLLLPLFFWSLNTAHAFQYVTLLASAMAVERLLYVVFKNKLKRRRPQDYMPGFTSLIRASDKFSFPSGHSSAAFCLATTTGIVFGGPFIALYIWASFVALSRVVLGVHFPGDTVAGALLGSGVALATASYLQFV